MTHLELFAGIGGFRRAIELVGMDLGFPVDCVGYSEIDPKANITYKANFQIAEDEKEVGDIVSFTQKASNIQKLKPFRLLTGGFPCQTFSMMGKQAGFNDMDRGQMFFRIMDIVNARHPKYLLLENVKNLYTHDKKRTFATIKNILEEAGYTVYTDIFNSKDFGLSQIRNRVYIFCVHGQHNPVDFSMEAVRDYFQVICDQASVMVQNSVCDVLQEDVPEKYYLSSKIKPTILSDGSGGFVSKSEINRSPARPLTATMHKMHRACQDNYYSKDFIHSHGAITNSDLSKEELAKLDIRRLTPAEAMCLQGFPPTWSENASNAGVSDGFLYKQAGNAVSVNVVYAILRYLIDHNYIEL